ncbi:hypothetical protein F5141DRAFT_1208826 [Pisolithus sp. B1]|nr:hypothetical protein F5141DRAFT_1208826 [Pisolithus sp. B1]
MAWGVFYRPQGSAWEGCPAIPVSSQAQQQPGGFIKEYSYRPADDILSASEPNHISQHPPQKPVVPRFRTPLPETVLDDPAFSADPRSHPHFPLTNSRSYKALPPKSPRSTVLPVPTLNEPNIKHPITPAPAKTAACPVSLDHEFRTPKFVASTPSTVSSTTSSRPSLLQAQGSRTTTPSVSRASTSFEPPPYTKFLSNHTTSSGPPVSGRDHPPMSYTMPSKTIQPRMRSQPEVTPARAGTASDFARIFTNKGRIKNLMRRLTKRYQLDRIDELDETDPFGIGFHHSGPYEAIANNLAKETSRRLRDDTDKSTGGRNNIKFQNNNTIRPPYSATNSFTENQIAVSDDRTAFEASTHRVEVGTISVAPRETKRMIPSDYTKLRPLPNEMGHSPELYPVVSQSSPSAPTPRVHHFGDIMPRIPGKQTPHINPPFAPYVPDKVQFTTYSHEPVQLNPSPSRSSELLPDTDHMAPQATQSNEGRPAADLQPLHAPLPKSASFSDASRNAPTGTPYSRDKPPRVHHLPKRLVMPAPLYKPQARELPSRPPYPDPVRDGRSAIDHLTVRGDPVSASTRTNQAQKLRRKKSSSFPSSVPLPLHPSIYQSGVGQTMGRKLSSAAVEGQRTHQETRRRRLSKRKVDV